MKWMRQTIQIRLFSIQLSTIKTALVYPKGDKGDILKGKASIYVAILGLLLTAFLIAALITVFSELDVLPKFLALVPILLLSFPFLYLIFWAYKFSEQVRKNGGLNEVEIWELQNRTQAKLKALTDA